MKTIIFIAALALPASTASAAPDGNEILKKVDEALNRATDQRYEFDVIDHQPGKDERVLELEILVKGIHRLISFTGPADVKGTKILTLSPTQIYIYLPAYKKVRRIASHVNEQGFMGTTFSGKEMASLKYAEEYTGTIESETESTWKIIGKARPGSEEAPYPRIDFEVDKKTQLLLGIEYFDDSGKKLKTEERSEISCEADICNAAVMKLTDHTSSGHWTKFVRKGWKVNTGLSDRLFTPRTLQRGS